MASCISVPIRPYCIPRRRSIWIRLINKSFGAALRSSRTIAARTSCRCLTISSKKPRRKQEAMSDARTRPAYSARRSVSSPQHQAGAGALLHRRVVDPEDGRVYRVIGLPELNADGLAGVTGEAERATLDVPRAPVDVRIGGEGTQHGAGGIQHLDEQLVIGVRSGGRLSGGDVEPERQ